MMKSDINVWALALAGLMLLQAVGLEVAHTETLGATIALFLEAFIALILTSVASKPRE